jgi:hypothetical protein
MITTEQLASSLSYAQYLELIDQMVKEGKSTGIVQSEEYIQFTKLNQQRMRRLDKTIVISEDLAEVCRELNSNYYFVILTESWCGDAAQNVPVFAALEKESPAFEVRLLLRDENPAVMEQYLTNGSRSIPKVICLEKKDMEQKFVWGPRPQALQTQVLELLKNGASKEQKGLFVQSWYNADKTVTLQKELLDLVRSL